MNILAIGAHPDDIEFGCGGTLLKYIAAGHSVYLFVVTDGSYGGDPIVRMKEQEEVVKFMGAQGLHLAGLQDTNVKDTHELIVKIEDNIKKVAPDIVFINYPQDVHQDHRAVAQASISATRFIKEVLFYEVPTTFRFDPDIFVDIHDVLEKKLRLLEMHTSQVNRTKIANLTILESAQSCANFRGYQGRVKYAEGFKALRTLREIR